MIEPLTGIRVVDLTSSIAGSFSTKLLAGLGAEVIKIEKPGEGDVMRSAGPFPGDKPHPECSGLFIYLNACKKSVTLDLETEVGASILSQLVKQTDILVENLPPSKAAELGLNYDELEKVNPRLVMTSVSHFGHTGPYRDYKATDITLSALSGLSSLTGVQNREPLRLPETMVGYMTGVCAATATMIALHYQQCTGIGQYIDISEMESIVGTSLAFIDLQYIYQGLVQKRGIEVSVHPRKIYACADGFVAVVVPTIDQWQALCLLMQNPELVDDSRFQTALTRAQNAEALDAILAPWLANQKKMELFHAGQERRIAISPVFDPSELLDDNHLQAREFFVEVEEAEAGIVKYPGFPFRTNSYLPLTGRAPTLGEHTDEVLGDALGYSNYEVIRLRRSGIV